MKSRTLRATALGALTGLLIGAMGPVLFTAANVGIDRGRLSDTTGGPSFRSEMWSTLTDTDALPFWVAAAVAGAANGGIGGWAGCRTGRGRVVPLLGVALLPLLFPLAVYAEHPAGGSKWWGWAFVVALFIIPFVWGAGRVGQELGARQRRAEPIAAPKPGK